MDDDEQYEQVFDKADKEWRGIPEWDALRSATTAMDAVFDRIHAIERDHPGAPPQEEMEKEIEAARPALERAKVAMAAWQATEPVMWVYIGWTLVLLMAPTTAIFALSQAVWSWVSLGCIAYPLILGKRVAAFAFRRALIAGSATRRGAP